MKTSKFIYTTEYPETGETLIYNTLNGSLLSFDGINKAKLREILERRTGIAVTTELEKLLAEEEFLVDDDFDETGLVLERSQMGINDENRLDFIIMPTMNCNFACPYCYEEHHQSIISPETQDRILLWFEQNIKNYKTVLINWFGGEPLLGYDAIVNLQTKLVKLCESHDVIFRSHITTNGYLLNKERIKKLIDLGIFSFQITIDGSPENHNKTRILKNGTGTFERIFKNIIQLANENEEVNIKLRVNYDDKNIKSVYDLLPLFPQKIRKQIILVCERIFGESYGLFEDKMLNHGQEVAGIYKYAAELGYYTSQDELVPGRLTFCYADRKNQYLINYNGDIFKCTVGLFKPEDRVGYISENGSIVLENETLSKWHAVPAFEEKCQRCVYMPVCMGGCRKVRKFLNTVGEDCTLPFAGFDKHVTNMYTQYLLNQT